MKAPDKIYINQDAASDLRYSPGEDDSKVEYIRADLAELTWEDMFKIVEIDMTLFERGTTQKDVENHFKEVLRRFLESKRKVEL